MPRSTDKRSDRALSRMLNIRRSVAAHGGITRSLSSHLGEPIVAVGACHRYGRFQASLMASYGRGAARPTIKSPSRSTRRPRLRFS